MKKILLFTVFTVLVFSTFSQSLIIQYPSHNTGASSSFYENDTLLLNLSNSKNNIAIHNPSFLKQIKIYKQGGNLISGNYFSGVDSTVQPVNEGSFIKVDSFYISVGSVFDQNTQNVESIYSINTSMVIDSLYNFIANGYFVGFRGVMPHPSNDSSILIYGSLQTDVTKKGGSFILDFNLVDKTYHIHVDTCWSNNFNDLLYDDFQNRYITTNYRPLCNGTDSLYGSSYGYLDSNFNSALPVSDHIVLNYTPNLITNTQFGSYLVEMEWATDSTIMVVGNIIDPLNIPKPSTSKSNQWGHDIGVSIRRASDFSEIDSTKTYGIVDVAEVYLRPILEKMDSNLFVTAANFEWEGTGSKPWNTELALLGLDENGYKHWMEYIPFNDYCWVQDIHPDDSGGLWVVAQCEEMPGSQAYEQFVKVMYIDSVAYWPRIGTVGLSEAENHCENAFKIYPNPADQMVTIRRTTEEDVEAEIMDVNGRLVKTVVLEGKESTFDVSELKSGMYFVKISLKGGGTEIKKLVIR